MRKSKGWILAALASLLVVLPGCAGSLELYERLLIHGIGVDKGEEGYVVTVRSSVSMESEGEEYFKTQGKSVLEALTNLSLGTGREPFYSHNYLVVFGRSCAEEGLEEALDFFARYYNTRPAVKMFLAENTAEEVLSVQKDGTYLKMSELQQLAESSRYNGKSVGMDILEFVNGVKREGSSPYLPALRVGENGVEVFATAFFDGYRFKDLLTLEETRGLLAVKEQIKTSEAVVSGEEFGTVTLSLSTKPGKVVYSMGENGRPQFSIEIEAMADISAISGGRNRLEAGAYEELENSVAKTLRGETEDAIRKAVLENRCDIFGFGNLIYQKSPGYWKKAGESWKNGMAECEYRVKVKARVPRLEEGG